MGQTTPNVNFALAFGGKISGTVSAAAGGGPIEGAEVFAYEPNGGFGFTVTAEDGKYVIEDLPEGTYDVLVTASGYGGEVQAGVVVSVGETTSDVDFALADGGTISGTVTESDGTPTEGVTVFATEPNAGFGFTTTTSDGTYSIGDLASGVYDVRTLASGFGTSIQDNVVVTAGQVTSGVDFVLLPGGSISGIITQDDGVTPIGGAEVSAIGPSDISGFATSATDGTYVIEDLAQGVYEVHVSAVGFVDDVRAGIAVTSGQTTSDVNFALSPVASMLEEGPVRVEALSSSAGLPEWLERLFSWLPDVPRGILELVSEGHSWTNSVWARMVRDVAENEGNLSAGKRILENAAVWVSKAESENNQSSEDESYWRREVGELQEQVNQWSARADSALSCTLPSPVCGSDLESKASDKRKELIKAKYQMEQTLQALNSDYDNLTTARWGIALTVTDLVKANAEAAFDMLSLVVAVGKLKSLKAVFSEKWASYKQIGSRLKNAWHVLRNLKTVAISAIKQFNDYREANGLLAAIKNLLSTVKAVIEKAWQAYKDYDTVKGDFDTVADHVKSIANGFEVENEPITNKIARWLPFVNSLPDKYNTFEKALVEFEQAKRDIANHQSQLEGQIERVKRLANEYRTLCNEARQRTENCENRDGWYCNGNVREKHDYGCTGEGCTYQVKDREDCDDGDPCTDDYCIDGECYHDFICECIDDSDCDDGDPCTEDYCLDGECYHDPIDCDDGDPCTFDYCWVGGVCYHDPWPGLCDDGDPCTDDYCWDGECWNIPIDCDDGDPCTDDFCWGGVCYHDPIDCNDGDPCTDDYCWGGECWNFPIDCDDGDSCTDDFCWGGECWNFPIDCDDGDSCTNDYCWGGECWNFPIDCDDGDSCTNDYCWGGVCYHDPIPDCPCPGGGNASRPPASFPEESTVAIVSAKGGSLQSGDGSVSVTFPAEAVSDPTTLVYMPQAKTFIPGFAPVRFFSLEAYREGGWHKVTSFNEPVIIQASYAAADLAGLDESKLGLYYFDTTASQWVGLPSTVNLENKTVTASSVNHFSLYGLMAPASPPPTSPFPVFPGMALLVIIAGMAVEIRRRHRS